MRSALLVLAACAGAPAPSSDSGTTPGVCTDLTWATAGRPTMTTWCTPCHSSALTGADRQGAPVGIDLDSPEGVRTWAPVIAAVALGDDASMPPVGRPDAEELAALEEWLSCGAPGTEPATSPTCPTVEGDLVVDAATPADVCAVTGDLVIGPAAPAQVELPALGRVDGALVVEDAPTVAVRLPALGGAVAAVRLARNPALAELDLGDLAEVAGAVEVTADGLGGTLEPAWLHTVGGALHLEDLPRLEAVATWRLERVGGDLVVEGLPALARLDGTESLESVGGQLRLAHAGLDALEGFTNLREVGDITLEALPITRLDAFTWTPAADAVALIDLPGLVATRGFHNLVQVAGPLRLTGSPLGVLDAFRRLESVGGLELRDVASPTLAPLGALRTVEGDLVLVGNPGIDTVTGLHGVEWIAGDLEVRDNPRLTPGEIAAWVRAIDAIGGDTRIE